MNERRILALSDDYEDTRFCDEDGLYYLNYQAFIDHLTHPHDTLYRVRYVYFDDIPENMDDIYEVVRRCEGGASYQIAFEQLWAIGEEY